MGKKGRKLLVFLFIFAMILNSISFADNNNLDLKGESVLLIDYDSERILYEKNPNEKMFPASTTKIMTAILAIELGNMDDMVEVDDEVIHLTSGSHIALDYDEVMNFEDLLYGLMVASANDSALALAKHISGSIDGFVALMNEKAKELGALDTNFVNPNGLHDDNHYTTAHDLFLISKYAMENETFRKYASESSYTIPPTNKKSEERLLHTTNRFLYGNETMDIDGKQIPIRYNGIKGIKTGTTPEAKHCLVSYAERDGSKMISIVLKSEGNQVYSDSYKLLNYGFENFTPIFLGHSNEFIENIDIEKGSLPYASTVLNKDIPYILKSDEKDNIERKLKLKDNMELPIIKGDTLGSAEYYLNGELIASGDILSTVDVSPVGKNSILQFLPAGPSSSKWKIILITIILIAILLFAIRRIIILKKKNNTKYSRYY